MRNILLIALAIFTINVSAQEKEMKKERKMRHNDFTPEQIAELQTKKMALALDLTNAQKKEIYQLNLSEAKERKQMMEKRKAQKEEGKKELTSDEKFEKANEQLDKKLAKKEAMKRILNEEQYAKWEEQMQQRNKHKRKVKGKKSNMHRDRQGR